MVAHLDGENFDDEETGLATSPSHFHEPGAAQTAKNETMSLKIMFRKNQSPRTKRYLASSKLWHNPSWVATINLES